MPRLVLLTLHGMGKTKLDYYADLESGLRKKLGALWSEVSLQPVQYAPEMQKQEDALWTSMLNAPANRLDWLKLREFFLYSFADAAGFEHSAHADKPVYLAIQQLIMDALTQGYTACNSRPDTPLVVVAQSLGGQVLSSYAWDAQYGLNIFEAAPPINPAMEAFRRLRTLRHLVTTGCNIPIFTAALRERKNFEPPHPQFRWDNYYDPDDVLGWPLQQLDTSYNMVHDHPVNTGGLLTAWNPASHTAYWDDNDVLSPLAASIKQLLN